MKCLKFSVRLLSIRYKFYRIDIYIKIMICFSILGSYIFCFSFSIRGYKCSVYFVKIIMIVINIFYNKYCNL